VPEIPRAPGAEVVPLPMINPAQAGGPYAAVQQAADQVNASALYDEQVFLRVQKAQDHVQALTAANEIEADKNQAIESFRLRSDFENFSADMESVKSQITKKYQQKYGTNPRLMRVLQPHLDGELLDASKAVETRRIALMTDQNLAELQKFSGTTQRKMAETDDPTEKLKLASKFYESVNASKESGLLKATEAYSLVSRFDMDAERTEIIEGTRSTDPIIVKATLEKIADKSRYPELRGKDPDSLAAYEASGAKWLDVLNNKIKVHDVALSVDSAIGELEKTAMNPDGRIDIKKAHALLGTQDFRTRNGLIDEQGNPNSSAIEKVQTYLSAFRLKEDEANKQTHDDYEKKVGNLFHRGDYVGANKMLASEDSPLTGDENRTWTEAIINRKKQAQEQGGNVSDALAIIKANDMIRRGEDPDKVRSFIIRNLSGKGDREQYLNKLDNKLSRQVEEGRNEGHSIIAKIIAPKVTNPLGFMMDDPKMVIPVMNAQQSLDSWIDKQNKAGKDLTTFDITNQAKIIATQIQPASKSVTSISDMADRIDQMAKDAEAKRKAKK
jgi:hypothetical protein